MMRPPGQQIYLQPSVILTFDCLILEVDRFMPLPRGPLLPTDIKISSLISKIPCGQIENIMPSPASVAYLGNKMYALSL